MLARHYIILVRKSGPSSSATGHLCIAAGTGLPLQAHASAAKAGIDALSRVLAVEYGPHGVRSNVIAPISIVFSIVSIVPKADMSRERTVALLEPRASKD
jgi:NAD(P)-dependent dehydrogenase (short-subunit alcohol dehydrogenase family)